MTSNIKQFLKDLERQQEHIQEEVTNIVKDITSEIYLALQEHKSVGGTPRITHWLVSNWIISLDTPNTNIIGSREGVNKTPQKVAFSKFLHSNLLNTDMIYINNLVPYGPVVNYGDANQIGQYFREKSIQRGVKRLNTQRVIK